jgi:hypothetical protein
MNGKTRRTSVQRDAGFGSEVLENLGQQAARIAGGRKLSGLLQLAQFGIDAEAPKARGQRQQVVLTNRSELEVARKEVGDACGADAATKDED